MGVQVGRFLITCESVVLFARRSWGVLYSQSMYPRHWISIFSAAVAVLATVLFSVPASAQKFWDDSLFAKKRYTPSNLRGKSSRSVRERTKRVHRAKKPAHQPADEIVARETNGELLAVVSLSSQRITVYDAAGSVLNSRVSTGMAGHRTPRGIFSILQKRRYHHSNIYSNAPMPYMQRLTWSGIALHAGVVPGYPASHGCIRLPTRTAARLFKMSSMGMRVVVARDRTQAQRISHPMLPRPVMVVAPESGGGKAVHSQSGAVQNVRVAAADDPTSDGPRPGVAVTSAGTFATWPLASRRPGLSPPLNSMGRSSPSWVNSTRWRG